VELGKVAQKYNVWMHVDAAYAGSAFMCPEYRHLLNGVEYFNPHMWMCVNFDCSALWLRESRFVTDAFNVDAQYLKSEFQGKAPEYRVRICTVKTYLCDELFVIHCVPMIGTTIFHRCGLW
jgi:aromatic-L-amino-acid/L-tryptophan decarboxylase